MTKAEISFMILLLFFLLPATRVPAVPKSLFELFYR